MLHTRLGGQGGLSEMTSDAGPGQGAGLRRAVFQAAESKGRGPTEEGAPEKLRQAGVSEAQEGQQAVRVRGIAHLSWIFLLSQVHQEALGRFKAGES